MWVPTKRYYQIGYINLLITHLLSQYKNDDDNNNNDNNNNNNNKKKNLKWHLTLSLLFYLDSY